MDIRISLPHALLEDIFRLLDYLDKLAERDASLSETPGRRPKFEHDSAFWDLKRMILHIHQQILPAYLETFDDLADAERSDFFDWIEQGNSIYDNPCSISNDAGLPMDFINGCRTALDLANQHDCGCDLAEPAYLDSPLCDTQFLFDDDDLPF